MTNPLKLQAARYRAARRAQRGVTLLELMIVLVIVGILATVAFPSYKAYVDRAKRAEAKALMMEAAARLERYFFDNNQYTTDATDLGYSAANPLSEEGNYNLSLAAGATGSINTSYALTAAPVAPHNDATCGSLTLDSRGAQGSSTGASLCWDK